MADAPDHPSQGSQGPRPALWRWVGVAAAVGLAASSWNSGALPTPYRRVDWPGLALTGSSGSPLLATASVLAMAVLVLAWWRLRRTQVSVRWWWWTAALWFGPLLASIPLYSRDLYSYAAQGALWAQGLNPYEHGVRELTSRWRESTSSTWRDTPSPYGPVWLLIARAAATFAGSRLAVALLVLRLVAAGSVVILAWAVSDVARRIGSSPSYAAGLAIACPLVGAHFVSGAHNDSLMMAGVLVGLALSLRRHFVWACVVVAFAAMVKVTALVALPFVALLWARAARADGETDRQWSTVMSTAVRAVAVAAVPVVALSLGTGLGFAWLNPAATPGKNEQWTSVATALGMAVGAVGHVLGHPDWRAPAIAAARAAALVVLAVVLVMVWLGAAKAMDGRQFRDERLAARAEAARLVRRAGWAFLAVIVLAPVVLGWYFLWPLLLFAPSLGYGSLDDGLKRWLPVVAVVLCFAQLPDGYSLGLTTTAVGVPVALVATGFLVRAGWWWAHRVDWPGLLDLNRPLSRPAATPDPLGAGESRIGDT